MVNPDLRKLPACKLPPGIELHWHVPGDKAAWIAIHKLADLYNEITGDLFDAQFSDENLYLGERQFYLLDGSGKYIATATAWAGVQGPFSGFGRLHWVAVIPEFQGKGLGGILVSVACQRLVELGYSRAFLTTSTLRPAAIHLYEKFGFRIVNDAGS